MFPWLWGWASFHVFMTVLSFSSEIAIHGFCTFSYEMLVFLFLIGKRFSYFLKTNPLSTRWAATVSFRFVTFGQGYPHVIGSQYGLRVHHHIRGTWIFIRKKIQIHWMMQKGLRKAEPFTSSHKGKTELAVPWSYLFIFLWDVFPRRGGQAFTLKF